MLPIVETTCIWLLDIFMKNCLFGIWFDLQAIAELQEQFLQRRFGGISDS